MIISVSSSQARTTSRGNFSSKVTLVVRIYGIILMVLHSATLCYCCYCCEGERIVGLFECHLGCPRCPDSPLDSWLYGTSHSPSSSTLHDWQYLGSVYYQDNSTRSFQLELDICLKDRCPVRIITHNSWVFGQIIQKLFWLMSQLLHMLLFRLFIST